MAVARALAFALDIPLVGVTAHEALRAAIPVEEQSLAVVLDARRDEIYGLFYAPGSTEPEGEIQTLSVEDSRAWLSSLSAQGSVRVVGDAVSRYRGAWGDLSGLSYGEPGDHEVRPEQIAIRGARVLEAGKSNHWLSVSPVYVRRSDAALGFRIKKTPGPSEPSV